MNQLQEGLAVQGNVYYALIRRLLWLMLLYTVCRLGFYFFNTSFFPDMTWSRMALIMWGGLRFDLSAILYVNSLYILFCVVPVPYRHRRGYQNVLSYWFIFTNALAFAANVIDFAYYRYTLRRTTISVFRQFENEQNVGSLLVQFALDYWYAVLFWVVIIVLLVWGNRRFRPADIRPVPTVTNYISGLLAMVLALGLFIGGVRGGFRESTRPITLSNAAEYAQVPKDINLVLNTPFAFLRTIRTTVVEKVNYFSDAEALAAVYTPLHTPPDSLSMRKQNVVVIILESFSKEFVGAYHRNQAPAGYQGHTPFLDSLIGVSRSYQYSFANGRKSIDAMPSVLCSIPSIEVPYVLSHFSGNKVNSLASLLREEDYYTAFFHGAPNGSMGFEAFSRLSGFHDYYGKTEYNNDADFDGIWGIWDEKFMQFFANQMDTFREPFFTSFFSVSSHHPFKLPEEYLEKFPEGPMTIHKCISYTDYSLRRFFEAASTKPWYKNTLFVITADHASAQIQYPQYNTPWGYFAVPVIFYQPGSDWHTMAPEVIQQIDIMPTVLGYLQYNKPYVAFGRDIFRKDQEGFAFNYVDNNYQLFTRDRLLQFDGSKPVALYNYQEDLLCKQNLLATDTASVSAMERRLKAFIQQYNNRMVADDLTREGPQQPAPNH